LKDAVVLAGITTVDKLTVNTYTTLTNAGTFSA